MAKQDKKAETTTEMTKPETKAMAVHDFGEDAVDVGSGGGVGYEHQSNKDIAIPMLNVLQAGSPVVVESKVEGAAAGMIMNSVTQDLWKNPQGLLFVPGTTRHMYTEFVPRDQGGGFKGNHEIDSDVVVAAINRSKNFGEYYTPEGNELVETFYVYGAIVSEDGEDAVGMAIFAFKSTMIKAYKMYMSLIRGHTVLVDGKKKIPPMFSHVMRVTTEFKKKNSEAWWQTVVKPWKGGVEPSMIGQTHPAYQLAKSVKSLMDSGVAKVDYSKAQGESGGGSDEPPF